MKNYKTNGGYWTVAKIIGKLHQILAGVWEEEKIPIIGQKQQ